MCKFTEKLSRFVKGFDQKSSFFSLSDQCLLLTSHVDSCGYCCYKSVNRSDRKSTIILLPETFI